MIDIEEFLSTDKFTSKQEIAELTGLSERAVRSKISDLKFTVPVIYNSYTKGYRLAKDLSNMSKQEIIEETNLIQHSIKDIQARKRVFDKQLRTYIAYLKVAEEKIFSLNVSNRK